MAENTGDQRSQQLEASTYELLRTRLNGHTGTLKERLSALNAERKEVFGTIETKVLATERVSTSNNCIPWDMVSFGNSFLFGYNVFVGLRSEISITDVFSLYDYLPDRTFKEREVQEVLSNQTFLDDFSKLYKYYKDTQFLRFAIVGPFLHMVFRIGKEITDIKTFKFQIKDDQLVYVDNRSDHEYKFPPQHEFEWKKTSRVDFREGLHPHVSIKDRVFVECIGGDLTVKIENNTEDGKGIYREDVVNKLQTLTDAEFSFAEIGNLIVIKARPYQEENRYLVFNEKLKEVKRIDAIREACVLLPDDQGLIFSKGYYLQSGEYKIFDIALEEMLFERRITSINGEDYIYVFYNRQQGVYLLLNYNIISQSVDNPIMCHGFTIFENGEMCLFKADAEPKKLHAIQIWQTPFTSPDFQLKSPSDSFLQKIGNKDVVRAMAECQDVINLLSRDQVYSDLYMDVIKKSTDVLDGFHWLGQSKEFDLAQPLKDIRQVAESAVSEFEKVRKIQESSKKRLTELEAKKQEVIRLSKGSFSVINAYVELLAQIRETRGEIISAKDMRYIDQQLLESFDQELATAGDTVSESCVRFLMQEHALKPFVEKVKLFNEQIPTIAKVVIADEELAKGDKIARELDLLIETVSNLKITDATQTTNIIEKISDIYGQYNQAKGALTNRRKSLMLDEGRAEFAATIKLLEQSVTNYLDISESPEQCEEYLTKLVVQIEELEGRFSEFSEFLDLITQKREEIYNAFETKKVYLTEQRNKKATQLYQSAERILKAIRNKADSIKTKQEINGYFASDLMVGKVRTVVQQLVQVGETVKADDLSSQLKTIQEDVIRQLKDKQELFVAGDKVMQMGGFQFYTNDLVLDLTIVVRNQVPCFHLAGTDFFEPIKNDELRKLAPYWDQSLPSENGKVYRAEYLAVQLYHQLKNPQTDDQIGLSAYLKLKKEEQHTFIQKAMNARYQEGYVKGIHEFDTWLILQELINLSLSAGVIRYTPECRVLAAFFWHQCVGQEVKDLLLRQIRAAAVVLSVFPDSHDFDDLIADLEIELRLSNEQHYATNANRTEAAQYLFEELLTGDHFTISAEAAELYLLFKKHLKIKKAESEFQHSLDAINVPKLTVRIIRQWLKAFIKGENLSRLAAYADEAVMLILNKSFDEKRVKKSVISTQLTGLKGAHDLIVEGNYTFHLSDFLVKLNQYQLEDIPNYWRLQELKKELSSAYKEELHLNSFKPRVLSSFVRNKLIDKVYFPLIGANLAKQIGTAGESKRTDLMGLLLLISPPGYGKTTLMEYIASRLGVIFMKINGPAIGHEVKSLDPADAPNAAAAEELEKLNLSFEMGNNVMIYIDDIQHCNPEFLQKFISMCDAQRKIEGVYKGKTKTYDFRGKKVCVVMAGNPYTESGSKFQIPDMLSNRADTYNLGDVIGDTEDVFKLSYIENALTSNAILARLAGRSLDDVQTVIRLAETGSSEGLTFQGNHTVEELEEYVTIIKHLMIVRDIILAVNMLYIKSAAMADEYRVEPPFKLQGSYRDMNKITEKILPMMSAAEVLRVVHSHYENEAQTLTSNAEANILKYKELTRVINEDEKQRWQHILTKFLEQQRQKGFGQNALLVEGIESIARNLEKISTKITGE